MKFGRMAYSMVACVATVLALLVGGCAASGGASAAESDRASEETALRCPAGFTMVCETRKVGRIRFGRMGKENLDSCSCEPENFGAGRSQQPALPQ